MLLSKIKVVVAIAMTIASIKANACTNLIVGKKASADGSVIVSYSADDFGSFGYLCHYPAASHVKGSTRSVYSWESNNYLGEIEEAAETYNVIGNMNEHQVTITETTFGGRAELVDTTGILDYGSLIYIALQRSRTAREAIGVITGLIEKYGYCSEGESFTLADKNEVWIMDLIGKGPGNKGAVWVAIRIPDDCIAAHANQSRIRKFPLKDSQNCLYAKDVISFAREKGYFKGKDKDFSFCEAYAPADFSALRFCEARVWSYFNRFADGMERYLPYASGENPQGEAMPLYIKPKQKISVQDIKNMMRDHYEGTPFEMTNDLGMGPYEAPYRPTPLTYEVDGKTYFNERPISTQQSAFTMVAQMRSWMPDYVGGVLWFGCDDANMIAFTPVYCCTTFVPDCYSDRVANGLNFSFKSAFWVCNWVSSIIYPRYCQLFNELKTVRDRLEKDYNSLQAKTEQEAINMAGKDSKEKAKAIAYLNAYTNRAAENMLNQWMDLGKYLMVKYVDGVVRPEKDGKFEQTPGGYGTRVKRPGYPERYRREIVRETQSKYKVK